MVRFFTKPKLKGEYGFGLVELIVVLSIISVLTIVAIPVYGAVQSNAQQQTLNEIVRTAYVDITREVNEKDYDTTSGNGYPDSWNTTLQRFAGTDHWVFATRGCIIAVKLTGDARYEQDNSEFITQAINFIRHSQVGGSMADTPFQWAAVVAPDHPYKTPGTGQSGQPVSAATWTANHCESDQSVGAP